MFWRRGGARWWWDNRERQREREGERERGREREIYIYREREEKRVCADYVDTCAKVK